MQDLLSRKSPVPLYAKVRESLRERITESGDVPHFRLPSERELARELGVSRMTVRQAVRDLVDEGEIFTAPGRGTFRAVAKLKQPLGALTSFTQDMLQRGMTPTSRVLEAVPTTDPVVAERLGLGAAARIGRIRRLRLADGEPMAIETTHVPLDLCPGVLRMDLEHRSLHEILRSVFRLRLRSAEQSIESRNADYGTAEVLAIQPGAPVLYIERHTELDDGRIVEFVRSYYRGDRYKFRIRFSMA